MSQLQQLGTKIGSEFKNHRIRLEDLENSQIDGISFNISDGILSVSRGNLTDLAVDLDGRYLLTSDKAADSNKLDGLDSTQFLRSDVPTELTSYLTISGSGNVGGSTAQSQYHTGADNIILKGNASGISGIFFQSEKDGTNINHNSDFGFIQYHPYGTGTAGESNELIIGVSNDEDDHLILNAPSLTGLRFRAGASETDYTIWHSGNDGSTSGLHAQFANQLPDNRTFALTGDVSGTVSSNLVGGFTINTTIADDSHNHIISNVDGLQTALDSKLSTAGKAADSDKLDGLDSSQFLRSDTADTMTGLLIMNNSIEYTDISRYWLQTATNWGIYWDTTNNTIEMHGAGTDRWSCDLDNGTVVQAGDLFVNGGNIFTSTSSQRVKLSVWDSTTYGIGMQTGYTFGGLDNNYAMSFQMDNTNTRGFWWGDSVHTNAQGAMSLTTNGLLTVAGGARIGFGEADTTAPTIGEVEINGLLTATSKSFTIPHPTKEGMKLRYGSLEGPENGVYIRGQLKGSNIIELPEYWTELIDEKTITVQLTSNGSFQKLYVKDIKDNKVTIGNSSWLSNKTDCFYVVYGERKDIDKLTVEF